MGCCIPMDLRFRSANRSPWNTPGKSAIIRELMIDSPDIFPGKDHRRQSSKKSHTFVAICGVPTSKCFRVGLTLSLLRPPQVKKPVPLWEAKAECSKPRTTHPSLCDGKNNESPHLFLIRPSQFTFAMFCFLSTRADPLPLNQP